MASRSDRKKRGETTKMEGPLKAVIYARYSSDNQREESIEGQLRECTAFIERNGMVLLRSYIDRAISGTTDNRPMFQEMIRDSEKGLFDVVVVWKLDRFARNRYDSARYKTVLKKNGVKVTSATEVISEGADGIILEAVLEGFAEYYSAELSEKVARGLTENVLKGLFNGGTIPMGYKIVDQRFEADPLTAPFILEAFKRYDEGSTMKEIRDWLNAQGLRNHWGLELKYNAIQHLLSNRRYIGENWFRDTVVPDSIPAIVPKELFDRVQEKLAINKKASARHKAEDDYLLTTKLFCGHCGLYMCGECGTGYKGNVYRYYKCVGVKKKKTCQKKPVPKEWIEDIVVQETMKLVMSEETVSTIIALVMAVQRQESVTLPLLEKRLNEVKRGIKNMVDAIQQGILTESTKQRLDQLEAAKQELAIQIANEKLEKPMVTEDFVRKWLCRFRKLDVSNQAHRKMLIDTFVNRIYLYDDKIIITFNYRDGTKEISLSEAQNASQKNKKSSDINCSGAPEKPLKFQDFSGFFVKEFLPSVTRTTFFLDCSTYGSWSRDADLEHRRSIVL